MASGRLAQSRVGVLGTGEVGRRLAAGFFGCGHDVMIGSRDPGKTELREWLSDGGAGIAGGTFAETAEHGELLVLAVLGDAAEQAIADAGPNRCGGKVVIDVMNPLDFSGGFPPKLSISGEDSLGERVQRALTSAVSRVRGSLRRSASRGSRSAARGAPGTTDSSCSSANQSKSRRAALRDHRRPKRVRDRSSRFATT